MRRALRALGERASTPEGGAIDMRSSRFVRVKTSSVFGTGTASLLGGLLKASSHLAAEFKFESARHFPAELSRVATAAGEAGTILKLWVPSCGRGPGNISRAAVSLPLTAVSKLAAVLQVPAESACVATTAGKAGALPRCSVPSCGRGVRNNSRAAITLALTGAPNLAAVLEVPEKPSRMITEAGKKGAKPKSTVLSCGRGEGNSSRTAASLPLTAVLKLGPVLEFPGYISLLLLQRGK